MHRCRRAYIAPRECEESMARVELEAEKVGELGDLWLSFSYDGASLVGVHCPKPQDPSPHFTLVWHGRQSDEDINDFLNATVRPGSDWLAGTFHFSDTALTTKPRFIAQSAPTPLEEQVAFARKGQYLVFLRYDIYDHNPARPSADLTRYVIWGGVNAINRTTTQNMSDNASNYIDDYAQIGIYTNLVTLGKSGFFSSVENLFGSTVRPAVDGEDSNEVLYFVKRSLERRF